jgi:NADH-ubiquinone oxidoreductase chain 6
MNNLLIINETFTNNSRAEMLDVISLLIIFCGIYVIISKNPIVSVLFLIGLFAGISSYIILIGLSFIGLSYLIIYIGAISILFLFILMLINIRISELKSYNKNSVPLALLITIFYNYLIFQLLPYNIAILNNYKTYLNDILYNISLNKSGSYLYKNKISLSDDLLFASYNS